MVERVRFVRHLPMANPLQSLSSNVFPDPSSTQGPQDLRETEGLTTRERMELEQQARMSQAASEAGGQPRA